jgi:hypothetical protein
MREPSFDETGAHDAIFAAEFLKTANRPMNFATRRSSSGPRHAPTPIIRAGF